jgi:flagellar motor switch protein FliM
MAHILSQEEIDKAFQNTLGTGENALDQAAPVYDFRRTDRISKDQLNTIRLLHENFARSMASTLSAYLRSYVVVNLISVEQLSFVDFSHSLPSPTSLITLAMKPYDGNALLELNPTLVFPLLEMLLGGSGKGTAALTRETTEIERSILDGLLRVILRDLETAWAGVAPIEFAIIGQETEPQLLQILAQNEAVVGISIEVRIGDMSGMMNIGIPSIVIKMLRQKFDQHRIIRRAESTPEEHARVLRLIQRATINLDARLRGPTLGLRELLDLREGDVLALDYPLRKPVGLTVNGKLKYDGAIVAQGSKVALEIQHLTVA